jgi:hypothetical protein
VFKLNVLVALVVVGLLVALSAFGAGWKWRHPAAPQATGWTWERAQLAQAD